MVNTIYCSIAIVLLVNIMIIFCRIKTNVLAIMIKEDIQDDLIKKYIKRFNKFNIFVFLSITAITFDIISEKIVKGSQSLFSIFKILKYVLDCALYPIIAYIFCFQKVPLKLLCPCYHEKVYNTINDNDKSIITMLSTEEVN